MAVLLIAASGCSLRVKTVGRHVAADDGYPLMVYRHRCAGPFAPRDSGRAAIVYITGSDDRSVLSATGHLAGLAGMGMSVFSAERRGVGPEGLFDPDAALAGCTKQRRVADTLAVIDFASRAVDQTAPLVLIGSSEGGDVAAAAARRNPRVTHLILIGCGGGWTQADELRHLAMRTDEPLGGLTPSDVEAGLARAMRQPDSSDRWLGHPLRRWSSFAFQRAADDVEGLSIPVLLLHGDRDQSVPVESARALFDQVRASADTPITYHEYAGVDHQFRDAQGRSALGLVELDVLAWMGRTGLLTSQEVDRYSRRVIAAHPELASPQLRTQASP
jgi:pimeloyl-ACP methyl ester carboxylesterase